MKAAIEFVLRYYLWIYLGLGLGAVWYLRAFFNAQRKVRLSVFGLEREAASGARARALSMVFVTAAAVLLVFLLVNYIGPNADLLFGNGDRADQPTLLTAGPTATSDQFFLLPGESTPTSDGSPTPALVNTQVVGASPGCDNVHATITSPLPGAVLAGRVEVQGAADIPNFAFYVLEVSTLGDNWLAVDSSNRPVQDGVLGVWDANLQESGNYSFRLVVYDSSNSFPEPCVIPITIGARP